MKFSIRLIALLGLFAMAFAPAMTGEEVTLEGEFVWVRNDGETDGPLKAVMTPTGEGTWDVSFHFDWDDGPHVYTGTCSGSMDGELSGDVVSDGERQMNFKFSGSFAEGTFSGEHGFVQDGEYSKAGTLTLSAAKSE